MYSVIGGGDRGQGGDNPEEEEETESRRAPSGSNADANGGSARNSTRNASQAASSGPVDSVGSADTGSAGPPTSASESTRSDDAGRSLDTISQEEVFDVLSNERRRHLLYYLKQSEEGMVELSKVSSQLAAWEKGTTTEYIDYADRKNVHTALYQFHLPKMADAGFVDYDQRSGRIELTDRARNMDIYLETVSGRDVPWGVYFLGLATAMTGFGVASWLELGPLADLPVGVPALFIAVTFLVSALVFAYQTHFEMRVEPVGSPADRE